VTAIRTSHEMDARSLIWRKEPTANHVGEAFRAQFGSDRVTELTDPVPVSEDFGLFGHEWKVPSLFWYVGGTDRHLYDRAAKAGRIAQDVPTNYSSKFAPILHPTPGDGD
jgi:metal-dependent amidase/aminoacylase/carboxypeptidase family protein